MTNIKTLSHHEINTITGGSNANLIFNSALAVGSAVMFGIAPCSTIIGGAIGYFQPKTINAIAVSMLRHGGDWLHALGVDGKLTRSLTTNFAVGTIAIGAPLALLLGGINKAINNIISSSKTSQEPNS